MAEEGRRRGGCTLLIFLGVGLIWVLIGLATYFDTPEAHPLALTPPGTLGTTVDAGHGRVFDLPAGWVPEGQAKWRAPGNRVLQLKSGHLRDMSMKAEILTTRPICCTSRPNTSAP